MAGFGFTGFLLTRVAMTVTDEDIKASSVPCPLHCTAPMNVTAVFLVQHPNMTEESLEPYHEEGQITYFHVVMWLIRASTSPSRSDKVRPLHI